MGHPRIAVIVPCYNEGVAIGRVVADFRKALPEAAIHVFDNDSEDDTVEQARKAGAQVGRVRLRGKGHVVRRLFADVDADVYLLVDGDDTYSAACAPRLVERLQEEGHDMVVGVREATGTLAYRAGHILGNRLLTGFLGWLFGRPCKDILSGYRVFSRRFVKSFPAQSGGFEIETELTVHALELHMSIGEIPTPYKERPEGSVSKLSTWRDGFRIMRTILKLFSTERPIIFYGALSLFTALLGVALGMPLLLTYLETGLVPRIPTAILVTALAVVSMLAMVAGLVLDAVARGRRELKALAYLRWPSPTVGPIDAGD